MSSAAVAVQPSERLYCAAWTRNSVSVLSARRDKRGLSDIAEEAEQNAAVWIVLEEGATESIARIDVGC